MIDSIQFSTGTQTKLIQLSLTDHKKTVKTDKEKSESTLPSLKTLQAAVDSTDFSFNLQGDLEELKASYAVLNEKVTNQLKRYFQTRGMDPESEEAQKFMVPEDASPQELMDFYSPQNTAQRIVSFATGFLNSYAANHTGDDEKENVENFTSLITNAVKKGFEEADKVLGNIEDLQDGEVAKNIKRTYELVLEGINQFRIDYLKRLDVPTVDPEVLAEKEETILESNRTTEELSTTSEDTFDTTL